MLWISQEENESARYYDACIVNVERKKHDVRGCRCKFMVQYEHNRSMVNIMFSLLYYCPFNEMSNGLIP
jgi:hypothetical protein